MSWTKLPVDREEVRQVAARYKCDHLTATILVRRAASAPQEARFFLEEDLRFLHNPFLLQGMEAAVDRIAAAVKAAQPIYLFGDRDVDGITSLVLLQESIRSLGGNVTSGLPEGDDEYGLSEKWVRRIHESGARLIVTVDCGISSRREVALASELGVDCIVTDHHNAPEELPECVALIDPKLDGSGYPFRELSGCGVAWKLDWALRYSLCPDYGREVCLLTTRPANDAVVVDAVRTRNLRAVDTLSETLLPGMVRYEGSRLERFLGGGEVVVYDQEEAARDLATVFGASPPVTMLDLRQELWAAFPPIEGQSLLRILEKSKAARYSPRALREIDLLADVHASLLASRHRALLEPAERRLDLVALGTLADLMVLRDENRLLVRRGMELLASAPRSGLRELLASQELLGRPLTTRDIAWKVTPVLNAAGRMGKPGVALELFLCEGMERAAAQASSLLELNRQRKALGDKVWDECRADAAASLEKTGGKALLVSGPRIHWGITGILAARLAAAFKAPAVVVAEQPERCVGSVRTPEGLSIGGLLERFDDILGGYGGHDFAAGFNLDHGRLEEFRSRFYEVARDVEVRPATAEALLVDAEIPPSLLTPKVAEILDRFEPYGEGNRPLTFLTRGLVVESVEIIGKPNGASGAPHAKLLLSSEKNRWPAVYWKGADRVRDGLVAHRRVDVVYRLERNHFMGMGNLRLSILDVRS